MRRTDDLTQGEIGTQLALLALPLILGNILQQLYNTVDALVVGRYLGHTAFAAVGVSGSMMNLFLFVVSGCCSGVSVIFAGLYGEKRWDALQNESFLSFAAGMALAVLLSAVGMAGLEPLLVVLQVPPEVGMHVRSYLRIIYLGLPAAFLYNWCAALLRAVGDTAAVLWVLLLAMVLNGALDVVLAVRLGLGIAGTAAATVIAQVFAAAVCLYYMRRRHPRLLFGRSSVYYNQPLLAKTVRFGLVSALHQSSLYIGKLLVQGAVNGAGTDMISAYTATARIEGFANSFGDSGCTAVSVFIAQNYGAGNRERLREGFRKGMWMMLILGISLSILMAAVSGAATRLLMGEVPVAVAGNVNAYIRVVAVFYVLCFAGNVFVGLFRGIGMVHIPVIGTAIHISVRVILSYLLIGKMGLAAVALATGIGWCVVVTFHTTMLRRTKRKA